MKIKFDELKRIDKFGLQANGCLVKVSLLKFEKHAFAVLN